MATIASASLTLPPFACRPGVAGAALLRAVPAETPVSGRRATPRVYGPRQGVALPAVASIPTARPASATADAVVRQERATPLAGVGAIRRGQCVAGPSSAALKRAPAGLGLVTVGTPQGPSAPLAGEGVAQVGRRDGLRVAFGARELPRLRAGAYPHAEVTAKEVTPQHVKHGRGVLTIVSASCAWRVSVVCATPDVLSAESLDHRAR